MTEGRGVEGGTTRRFRHRPVRSSQPSRHSEEGGGGRGEEMRRPTAHSALLVIGPASLLVLAFMCVRGTRKKKLPAYNNIGKVLNTQGSHLQNGGLTRRAGASKADPVSPLSEGSMVQRMPPQARRVQAIFDIDDTIKSSGNYNILGYSLGGVDAQYARGVIYPGVAQFAYELSCHALPSHEAPAPVAVLTARAKELGPALKLGQRNRVVKAFQQTGADNGHAQWGIGWDKGCVLYGSVAEWVRVENRGLRKFHNFKETLATCTHPCVGGTERNQYILVGDTGEWDLHCGELMLENYAQDVMGVFMHCVSNDTNTAVPHDTSCCDRPICFFLTYPGAARKAYQHGLLTAQAMLRVCDAASADLRSIEASHPSSSKWSDLERDIELCKVLYVNSVDTPHVV